MQNDKESWLDIIELEKFKKLLEEQGYDNSAKEYMHEPTWVKLANGQKAIYTICGYLKSTYQSETYWVFYPILLCEYGVIPLPKKESEWLPPKFKMPKLPDNIVVDSILKNCSNEWVEFVNKANEGRTIGGKTYSEARENLQWQLQQIQEDYEEAIAYAKARRDEAVKRVGVDQSDENDGG